MKKLIIITLLLSSTAPFAFAQGLPHGFGHGNQVRPATATGTTSSTHSILPGIRNRGGNKSTTEAGKVKMITGTVKSVGSTSFVLSNERGDYTINVSSSTRVVSRIWQRIALADIHAADKIRVYGRVASFDVKAIMVRDISLPPHVIGAPSTGSGTSTSTSSSTRH